MSIVKEELAVLRKEASALATAVPQTMRAFQDLMRSASSSGSLDAKTKELMALAIAVAVRCDGCVAFHVQNVIRHGGKREEVAEAVAVAIEMSGGPGTVYGGKALATFDELCR